jgi:hypothetical protein
MLLVLVAETFLAAEVLFFLMVWSLMFLALTTSFLDSIF